MFYVTTISYLVTTRHFEIVLKNVQFLKVRTIRNMNDGSQPIFIIVNTHRRFLLSLT